MLTGVKTVSCEHARNAYPNDIVRTRPYAERKGLCDILRKHPKLTLQLDDLRINDNPEPLIESESASVVAAQQVN